MTMMRKRPRSWQGAGPDNKKSEVHDSINTSQSGSRQANIELILSIWRAQPEAKYFCIWRSIKNSDHEEPSDRRHKWFTPDRLEEVQPYADRYVATHNLFAAPSGFKRPSRRAGSEAAVRMLWADLDKVDPRELPQRLRPHVAVESSPERFVGLWLADDDVPEELNQRLTYTIGADKGGWAANKLLRLIPDTINHKYLDKPRVKLLWDERTSRPPLAVAELEALPPVTVLRKASTAPGQRPVASRPSANRDELIDRYASRRDLLREHLHDFTPWPEGVRSGVTWKWVMTLMERGANDDEVFVMVEPCGFNKHTPIGLWRTVAKARAEMERRS